MNKDKIRVFDPHADYSVVGRRLPHWTQAGTLCFITWRTEDSMPREVVARWIAERNELLLREGIRVDASGTDDRHRHWKTLIERLAPRVRWKLLQGLTDKFDTHLDVCHGACLLRVREAAEIVAESLSKFDGEHYELADFVIMPNHVHLLAAFADEKSMLTQCANWKRYTARKINATVARSGPLWQEDAFDHLVRDTGQFEHFRRYIAENGSRAKLPAGDYLSYAAKM